MDIESITAAAVAGETAALAGMIVGFVIAIVVFYVYYALAYMTIARKLGHPYPWLAWIPFANAAMLLQLGGFHWAWIFLVLIPILGWIAFIVLSIIAMWRIYVKRNYQGWLVLIPLLGFIPYVGWIASLANAVIVGFVAWKDR